MTERPDTTRAPRVDDIHLPVMLERTLELLGPALDHPGAVLVDATLGMGGHAEAFLNRFPELTVIGIDRDPDALAIAGERLAAFGPRIRFAHAVYDELASVLDRFGVTSVSGVLFDLGVSSLQLDRTERGFSYSQDAPLDMRMDKTLPLTAERILAEYSEADLRRIFWAYGEEKLAPRYARRIVEARTGRGSRDRAARRPHRIGHPRSGTARRSPRQAGVPGAAH